MLSELDRDPRKLRIWNLWCFHIDQCNAGTQDSGPNKDAQTLTPLLGVEWASGSWRTRARRRVSSTVDCYHCDTKGHHHPVFWRSVPYHEAPCRRDLLGLCYRYFSGVRCIFSRAHTNFIETLFYLTHIKAKPFLEIFISIIFITIIFIYI